MAPDGLAARDLAVAIVEAVVARGRTIDEALARTGSDARFGGASQRDRAFARLIAATAIRHRGRLQAALSTFIERPLPTAAMRAQIILLCASAQLLLLATPPHAAIHQAVEQCRRDRAIQHLQGLTNAVLRRVAREGASILDGLDGVACDMPPWLLERWTAAWGPQQAHAIAAASLQEAALDLTVAQDVAAWAERLGGLVLPTGSIRLSDHAPVEELPGFAEGVWWVQDAAATLPARLLGDVRGRTIADLCAAPGGKTAQLAAAGGRVVAVDASASRLDRLRRNLDRLRLGDRVEVVCADVMEWTPSNPVDDVLLDAPCSATGTIRRHPDILALRTAADVTRLAALQARLLDQAANLLPVGGRLIYCTCSLEPEEGPDQIAALLARRSDLARSPITADEIPGMEAAISAPGDLRTLPSQMPVDAPYRSGMDGFFAARVVRTG